MKIQKIPISKINPAPYNPRMDLKPGDAEYEKLKQSILNFGYVEPLVWNKRTGSLVGGHQRLKVLVEEGFTEVEVSVVDLPLNKEKALNIALNRISGDWDQQKLAKVLGELKTDAEIDIELTGFDIPEISQIFDEVKETKEDDFDFCEVLKEIEKPITKKGDLIMLGKHKLLCGDSSKKEDVEKLLGGEKINLIFTDPPYNVNYYGGNRPTPKKARPKNSRNWRRIYSDNLTQEEYEGWLKTILGNLNFHLAEGAPIYIWNGHRQFGPMYQMLAELDFHISCVITWEKPNFSLGYGDYNQQTEFCLYAWKSDNGAHNWYGPTNESTLWKVDRDPTNSYNHPTQKPVALAARALKNSSKRGDVVVDVFLGSGTTLIASEELERRCFGIEIDPRYCDAIVKRYVAFVGKENISKELREKYNIK
jgi:DNA modification methylase